MLVWMDAMVDVVLSFHSNTSLQWDAMDMQMPYIYGDYVLVDVGFMPFNQDAMFMLHAIMAWVLACIHMDILWDDVMPCMDMCHYGALWCLVDYHIISMVWLVHGHIDVVHECFWKWKDFKLPLFHTILIVRRS